jgi:hypothetical protein
MAARTCETSGEPVVQAAPAEVACPRGQCDDDRGPVHAPHEQRQARQTIGRVTGEFDLGIGRQGCPQSVALAPEAWYGRGAPGP